MAIYVIIDTAPSIVSPRQPHGGKRAGSGRKPIPDPDRPMCCGKPTYKHAGGRWRCSMCKALYKIPTRFVDNQLLGKGKYEPSQRF
jgi:hypothetical protein